MIEANYDATERTLAQASLLVGSVGAVASSAVAALLSKQSARAAVTTLPAAFLVCGAAGRFYAQYRIRKAVEAILSDPNVKVTTDPTQRDLHPDDPHDPTLFYYLAIADTCEPWKPPDQNQAWYVGAWPIAYDATAAHAIYVGALRAEWTYLLTIPHHVGLLQIRGTGGYLLELVLTAQSGKWEMIAARKWRLGPPYYPPVF